MTPPLPEQSERDRLVAQQQAIERRLREIEHEETYRERLTPEQRLAEDLHEALCCHNHTDACAWLYERPQTREGEEWEKSEHRRWLAKAQQLAGAVGMDKAASVVPLLKEMR